MKLMDYVTGIQHIGIPTNDIEATKAFYIGLGFEVVHETINESDGNTPVAFLQAGDILIETYENKKAAMARGAIDHLALNVPDIEPAYALAKEKGYRFLESDEIVFLPFWEKGIRYFLIEGPNKEPIEFLQKL